MSDSVYCLGGLAAIAAVFALAVVLLRSVPRVKIFDDTGHIFRVWREVRGFAECLLFFCLLARYLSSGATVAILLGVLALGGPLLSGLCGGPSPEVMAIVRDMLRDAYNFILKLIRPDSPGLSRSLSELACRLV